MRRRLLALLLCLAPLAAARAASITDATGRTVQVPEHVAHVLAAGPPAAVLLAALAPDLLLGWPHPPGPAQAALLDPHLAALPATPHVAPDTDAAVVALHPDLILDYGTVSPAYIAQARDVQQRTGIASLLLDGSLTQTARVLRLLGTALHREQRAETLALLAEAMLAEPQPPARRVVYLRGTDTLRAAAAGTGATEVFAHLGWQVLSPPGQGTFRPATRADVAALDPDVIVFADPAMRAVVAASPDWRALRAVREGHAYTAPRLPFGWIEEPPSLNQLLGVAWLGGRDPATLAALFYPIVYGHVLTADELRAVAETAQPLPQ